MNTDSRFAVRNLFGIEGLNIAWYGIIIVCGMILCGWLAIRRCRKTGLDPDHVYNIALILIPVCMICARAYYVIFQWDYYSAHPDEIVMINQGGLAIYGGIIGGVIAAILYCRIKKVDVLLLMDTVIPSLPLGQAIGRWGNFVNQEAYGNLITNEKMQFFPYGVYIEDLGEWHQATFFYESVGNLALFCLLVWLLGRTKKVGYMLPTYMIGYGIIRTFVEGMRADSLYLVPGVIRVSQLLSVVILLGGVVFAILVRRFGKEKAGAGSDTGSEETSAEEQSPEPEKSAEPENVSETEDSAEKKDAE